MQSHFSHLPIRGFLVYGTDEVDTSGTPFSAERIANFDPNSRERTLNIVRTDKGHLGVVWYTEHGVEKAILVLWRFEGSVELFCTDDFTAVARLRQLYAQDVEMLPAEVQEEIRKRGFPKFNPAPGEEGSRFLGLLVEHPVVRGEVSWRSGWPSDHVSVLAGPQG